MSGETIEAYKPIQPGVNGPSVSELAAMVRKAEKKVAEQKAWSKEDASKVKQQAVITARETAEAVEKISKEDLDRMDDGELLEMRRKLVEGERAASADSFFVQLLGNNFSPALQMVEGQLQERNIVPDNNTAEPLEHQLIKQWARAYAGDSISIRFANVKQVEKQIDETTGTEIYIIPSNTELSHFIVAARLVVPESPTRRSELNTLAQNLQDAAILLAQQRKQVSLRSDGTVSSTVTDENAKMFQDEVIVELYEKGKRIQEFIKTGELPSKTQQKKTVKEYEALRQEIEQQEIIPQYYRQQSQEVSEEVTQTEEYVRVERLNNERLLMFVLGKNTPTDLSEPASFYSQWFQRIMDRGGRTPTGEIIHSEAEFWAWIGTHQDQVMRRIAPFINRTRISEQLQRKQNLEELPSQQKARQAIEKGTERGAKEELYKAISEKGKAEQAKLMDYEIAQSMTFSHEKAEEMTRITEAVFPESQLSRNVAMRLAELPPSATLQQRLEALNRAVAETYTIPQESSLKNYEPMLALQEGEFACSIRSIVLNKLIEQHMGSEFIQLGGSEWKHSTLFMVDKSSLGKDGTPRGYFISTGGKDGYVVVEVTDAMLEQPFMQPLINAIHQDGDDVMIHLQLRPKDAALAQRIGGSMTIGNVDKINESHVWINEAAAKRTADDPSLSPEMQLQDAQRALLLNPFSETALGLIVKLTKDNPDLEALYRTSLRKLQLLNPDLTEEQILAEEDFTVNLRIDNSSALGGGGNYGVVGDPGFAEANAIRDSIIKSQIGLSINQAMFIDPRSLQHSINQAERLPNATVPGSPAYQLLTDLNTAYYESFVIDSMKAPLTILTENDFQKLVLTPETWLMDKANSYSDFFDGLKDVNSPLLAEFDKEQQEAFKFLTKYHRTKPEIATNMEKAMNNRKNARYMHLMLRLGLWDKIPGQGQQLGLEGICLGLAEDNGRVGSAFTKLSTRLDTARMDNKFIDLLEPDKAKFISEEVIGEELSLAEKNLGEYALYYEDVRINAQTSHKEYYEKHLEIILGRKITVPPPPTAAEIDTAERATASEITKAKLKNNFRYARDLLYCSERFYGIAVRGYSSKAQWRKSAAELTITGQNLTAYLYKWVALTYPEQQFLARMESYCTDRELDRKVRDDGSANGRSRSYEKNLFTRGEKVLMGEPLYNRTKNSGEMFGGWAIEDMRKAMEARVGKEISDHIMLFMQLKRAYEKGGVEGIREQKRLLRGDIRMFYPEVLVEEFRNHDRNWEGHDDDSARIRKSYRKQWGEKDWNTMLGHDRERFRLFNDMMNDPLFSTLGTPDHTDAAEDSQTNDARTVAQYRYDMFRQRYDNVMSTIRQMAINECPPRQVDFTSLTIDEQNIINRGSSGGNAMELMAMMRRMQHFSQENQTIDTLLYDLTFSDMYHRVLRMDDARPDLYESQKKLRRNGAGQLVDASGVVIPINSTTGQPRNPAQYNTGVWDTDHKLRSVSSTLSADPSGDLVERKWGDKKNSKEQGEKEIAALQIHPNDPKKVEAMMEAANSKKNVDGVPGFIEAFEPELMTLVELAQPKKGAQALGARVFGVRKLPRWMPPLTELEDMYGYSATGMSPEETLGLLEQVKAHLVSTDEEKAAAEKIYNQCVELAAVAPNDLLRRKIILLGIFAIIAVSLTGFVVVEKGVQLEAA